VGRETSKRKAEEGDRRRHDVRRNATTRVQEGIASGEARVWLSQTKVGVDKEFRCPRLSVTKKTYHVYL
jgi:hypothetical protein